MTKKKFIDEFINLFMKSKMKLLEKNEDDFKIEIRSKYRKINTTAFKKFVLNFIVEQWKINEELKNKIDN